MERFLNFTRGCWIVIYLLSFILNLFWTDRNLDFWVSYLKGETVDIPFYWSILLALLGPVDLVMNLIAEFVRFCVTL